MVHYIVHYVVHNIVHYMEHEDDAEVACHQGKRESSAARAAGS